MPIRSRKNQYQGVNAHLQSALQNDGGWDSFHINYISDLGEAIDSQLPPGYLVNLVRSFQPHNLNLDDSFYSCIVIYKVQNSELFENPVTRIELLTPTTKENPQQYFQYSDKREAVLKNGQKFIEVDYLHETLAAIRDISIFLHENASFAYEITVYAAIPHTEIIRPEIRQFSVDYPIPIIPIPLAGEELLVVDFGKVYDHTFQNLKAYSYQVDYEQLPVHFERYSPADQERIKQRMQAVIAAHREGRNLEEGPFALSNS
jgi:hypothetical protein